MQTFDHYVRLGGGGELTRCTISDNAELITQIIPQFGFELSPSICGDSGFGTKTRYAPTEESISDHLAPIRDVDIHAMPNGNSIDKWLCSSMRWMS